MASFSGVSGRPGPPLLGLLGVAQGGQLVREVTGRPTCRGMVVAEDPSTPRERLLVQGPGLLVLPGHGEIDSEVGGRSQRRWVVVAENLSPALQRVLLEGPRLAVIAEYS